MNEETQNEHVELPPEVQKEAPEPPESGLHEPPAAEEQPREQVTAVAGSEEILLPKGLKFMDERFDTLENMFQSKIKYDSHKEKIIDGLHRELQEYKNDQTKTLLRPVIMDIIQTIDDIARLVNSHKEKEPEELDPLKLIKQLEGLGLDLTDILFRQGVEPYHCPQPEFDPKRQKIIKTEPCTDQARDKMVALRIQPGYEWDTRVLRQEKVGVCVFTPGSDEIETDMNKENES